MAPPKDWYEPLVMPGILTIFGVLVCWLGWLSEGNGKSAPWKWFGVVLLLAGMWIGYTNYFSHIIGQSPDDKLYRAGMFSPRRYLYAHYLSFFLPFLAMIGCIILQFVKKPAPSAAPAPEQ